MANSADPDQMLHSGASDLGLYCLQRPVCANTKGFTVDTNQTILGLYSLLYYQNIFDTRRQMVSLFLSFVLTHRPHSGSFENQGPVWQSVVSLTSSSRVISLTVLADPIYNILIFFAEKM